MGWFEQWWTCANIISFIKVIVSKFPGKAICFLRVAARFFNFNSIGAIIVDTPYTAEALQGQKTYVINAPEDAKEDQKMCLTPGCIHTASRYLVHIYLYKIKKKTDKK